MSQAHQVSIAALLRRALLGMHHLARIVAPALASLAELLPAGVAIPGNALAAHHERAVKAAAILIAGVARARREPRRSLHVALELQAWVVVVRGEHEEGLSFGGRRPPPGANGGDQQRGEADGERGPATRRAGRRGEQPRDRTADEEAAEVGEVVHRDRREADPGPE